MDINQLLDLALQNAKNKNYLKAFDLYTQASQMGSSEAMFHLGQMYDCGIGVEQDSQKAFEYFFKSANLGNISAMYCMGEIYLKGEGVEQDICKAIEYFTLASDSGDSNAKHALGALYERGEGIERDIQKAIAFYSEASDLGNSEAICSLALLYAHGEGVKQDLQKASEYFCKASEMGNTNAASYLANINKKDMQKDKDKTKIQENSQNCDLDVRDVKKGCALGGNSKIKKILFSFIAIFIFLIIVVALGFFLKKQDGVRCSFFIRDSKACLNIIKELDSKESAKIYNLYLKACEYKSNEACLKLGDFYFFGNEQFGITQNENQSLKYYYQGCEYGNGEACLKLGKLEKDAIKAQEFYKKGCNYNNPQSCYEIAKSEKNQSNDEEAIMFYKKSCEELSYAQSCYELGEIYKNKKDFNNEKFFLEKASQIDTKNYGIHLGVFFEEQGDKEASLQVYEEMCEKYKAGGACYRLTSELQDIKRAQDFYNKACEYKSNEACLKLGDFYFFGNEQFGITQNENQSLKYYYQGCEYGNGEACLKLGKLEKDAIKAQEFYKKGCNYNNPQSCYEIAKSEKNQSNDEEAIMFYKKSCEELSYAQSCYELGEIYSRDYSFFELEDDKNKMIDFYNQACNLKYAQACSNLAKQYDKDGMTIKAVGFYDTACKYGDAYSCHNMALARMNEKLEKNYKNIKELFEYACEKGYGESCFELGKIYQKGDENFAISQDLKKAFEYFFQGCKEKSGEACLFLGKLYQEGSQPLGISKNLDEALKYFKLGCKNENGEACYKVWEKNKNTQKGIEYLSQSAEFGNPDAYKILAEEYRGGNHLNKDLKKALFCIVQSCKNGDAKECKTLADMYQNGSAEFGIELDDRVATLLYKHACDKGEYEVCDIVAERLSVNIEKKLDYYTKACQAKNDNACYEAGKLSEELGKNDLAIKTYQDSCDLGDGEACFRLGELGVEQGDNEIAKKSFSQSCNLIEKGCYEAGKRVKENEEKKEFYKKACEIEKERMACFDLANILRNQDVNKAKEYYKESCEHIQKGCVEVGEIYANEGYKKESIEYFQKACENGDGESCLKVGEGTKNKKIRRSYYQKACNLNQLAGCLKYAQTLKDENASDEEIEGAYRVACEKGNFHACKERGEYWWKKWDDCKFWYCGEDKKKAKEYYSKACELGDETSCQKENELK